jgi:hypothetical protein
MSFYAYVKQPDDEVCVWHYMDLARYMLLLEQRALFFEQVDAVDCQFEGYGTIGNVAPGTNIHDAARETTEFSALSRASLVISCWHMGDCESAALWQLHADAPVAIKSTVQRLKKGLNYSLLKYVKIGAVNYQPPAILSTEAGVSIEVDYFFKRQSFAHEREVRILAHARDLDLVTRNGGCWPPPTSARWWDKSPYRPKPRPGLRTSSVRSRTRRIMWTWRSLNPRCAGRRWRRTDPHPYIPCATRLERGAGVRPTVRQ